MWACGQADIPPHEVSAIEHVDNRRQWGTQVAIVKFNNEGNRRKLGEWVQAFKGQNQLKYWSQQGIWHENVVTGRYTETQEMKERSDHRNVAWQIMKELYTVEGLHSEQGAYLNYPKCRIVDKGDNLPLAQVVYQSTLRGRPSTQQFAST